MQNILRREDVRFAGEYLGGGTLDGGGVKVTTFCGQLHGGGVSLARDDTGLCSCDVGGGVSTTRGGTCACPGPGEGSVHV